MAGAVDLAVLKERADAARAQAARPATGPAGPGEAPSGAALGPAVVEVTEANFEADVLTRSRQQLVVVVLWSARSPVTAQLVQVLAGQAQQSGGRWALAAVDADTSPRIVQAFQAQGVPLVIAIAHGRPVAEFEGRSEQELADWIDSILSQIGHTLTGGGPAEADEPEEVDPRMLDAEAKLDAGDYDGALAVYRDILAAEPDNDEVAALIRNIEFMSRADAHDDSVLDSAPDDVDGQLAAADKLLLAQQPEEAFDRIITAIKLSAGDHRTKARTRLLELFELFDAAEPFVVAARRKLAAALY
ncbi:tetratricopeptide repeat protein [Gordonia sp. TBRC 11910]|uniref:Tetratricopeptide repeat protein n=1 Tax=Gordonia asplenii TaxID=2725283 RepID=A0A848L015_9ACTN|nr:tetratricopeptide repeat protein [Gordonia asplenii]NMO04274.1 tetratricopeptide repeat protein [Gordonia asplenii]